MKGEKPFQKILFHRKPASTFGQLDELLGDAHFPAHKRDLAGRVRGVTVEIDEKRSLPLDRIIEEAEVEQFSSMAQLVAVVEVALDRGSVGKGSKEYPANRPHG